ncbi:ABC transporter substrate-binding protein [Paenibacillus crassostreae]|uniref:ABC transporter substrate-binding protein n=1 Tax=Paenibacillus crassostreae TaxID=1763538 RepID=A0A167FRA8_9BACL|nr:ABC transporter substrate-binding protein [Paenibacillus crassostreae]AOZ94142.1 ABC transporter substrate-binding protein [Paenibacillus crassostreae]OAB76822.1 ABC transporter substrate-binding protein [Paenibacillus crassostreae]
MRTRYKKRMMPLVICLLLFAMMISACSGNTNNAATTPAQEPAKVETEPAVAEPTPAEPVTSEGTFLEQALAGEFKGTTVSMFGPFVDEDEQKFTASIKDFEDKTGIDIQYEGSKEFEATISIRVDGGNAPDIADFPQPGLLANFAKQGKVIDVSSFIDKDYLAKNYNQSWLDMANMDGANGEIMAGIWARSSVKSLVWYPKKQFDEAGYTVPQTWDEMLALTKQIAEDGDPAWSIGIGSGAATGWPATDWIEDIMLRTTSPENYDKWITGELSFTSPEVKNAFEVMSDIWFNEDYVLGGVKSIVTTASSDALDPLAQNPAQAWLHRQASFITSNLPNTITMGEDIDFFYLPPIDAQYGKPLLVAGDIYSMFNDRPEVRAVMEFFTTGESIKTWIQSGGVIAPMNDADLSWYSNDVDRRMAELVQSADTLRFDGSDLMIGAVGAGTFWKGATDYVSGTVDLDGALKEIQEGFPK